MCRVVLPLIPATQRVDAIAAEVPAVSAAYVPTIAATERVDAVTAANVGIAIEIVVAVDVDIATAPTAAPTPAAAPKEAHGDSHPKRDRCSRIQRTVVRRIVDCRVRI